MFAHHRTRAHATDQLCEQVRQAQLIGRRANGSMPPHPRPKSCHYGRQKNCVRRTNTPAHATYTAYVRNTRRCGFRRMRRVIPRNVACTGRPNVRHRSRNFGLLSCLAFFSRSTFIRLLNSESCARMSRLRLPGESIATAPSHGNTTTNTDASGCTRARHDGSSAQCVQAIYGLASLATCAHPARMPLYIHSNQISVLRRHAGRSHAERMPAR